MTLVVASIENNAVWMVSDAAITGNSLEMRHREYFPKVEMSLDGRALVGFAGAPEHGARIARAAANAPTANAAVDILVDGSSEVEADFAYAYFESGSPRLLHIAKGHSENVATVHLGSHDAFEVFQKLRHSEVNPYAPLAFKNFQIGFKQNIDLPGFATAIRCMIDLFASRAEHDVGGWAVPYMLTSQGGDFIGYAYAVSDPIFDKIAPGFEIPHGTQQGGGSSLSVTELGHHEGMVVYWLQVPGGTIYVRTEAGYETHILAGRPREFIEGAENRLGRQVDLWLSDEPLGPVKSVKIFRDGPLGAVNAAIASDGRRHSFAVHNLAVPFKVDAEVQLSEQDQDGADPFLVKVGLDRESVTLTNKISGDVVELDASGLDKLISKTTEARAQLQTQVPNDLPSGARLLVAHDPRWQTDISPHPSMDGIYLKLRHPGAGWVGFLLPHHEAISLATWLHASAKKS